MVITFTLIVSTVMPFKLKIPDDGFGKTETSLSLLSSIERLMFDSKKSGTPLLSVSSSKGDPLLL